MRHIHLFRTAALAVVLPALITNASAQERKDQRGGGAGPAAAVQHAAPPAPAPHIAAPAAVPHVAAPAPQVHVAVPVQQHIAAPAPHINATPHITSVQPQHIATPQIAHHDTAATRREASHVDLGHGNGNHANAAAGTTRQQQLLHANGANTNRVNTNGAVNGITQRGGSANRNAASLKGNNPGNTGANVTTSGPAATRGANATNNNNLNNANKNNANNANPATIGQARGRNAVNQPAQTTAQVQAQAQARAQIYAAGRKPVLRNPVFTDAARRDPALRALARATFQGRFAAFRDHDRFRDRDHFRGIVIGWAGPVFWPYAYDDFVDYTFYPYANDTFWPYAYDDVYQSIFGGYAPYATAYASARTREHRYATRNLPPPGTPLVCSGDAAGLTDYPIEQIVQQVQPTDDQRVLLNNLKDNITKAVNLLQSSCPTDLPSTPIGRLAQMRQRIESMLQAVQIGRPALEKLYASLNDEQKERFIALEGAPTPGGTTRTARQQPNLAQACGSTGQQITGLPINQIEQIVHPSDVQRTALQELADATAKAAATLKENCPQDQSLTPPARLATMEQRLNAMLRALNTEQPALAKFYNSLSDEQKARFDRMPPPRVA
jgi:hypothetical protein